MGEPQTPAIDLQEPHARDVIRPRLPARTTYLPVGAPDEVTVSPMRRVEVMPIDPRRLERVVGRERIASLTASADALNGRLEGRRLVNVSSTATGGGVAELLRTLVGYALGMEVECEWRVIEGDPAFFHVTKRLHNGLYGSPGDGGALGAGERAAYEQTVGRNAEAIPSFVRPGDIVIVHDPQPAPLVSPLIEAGAVVVWRCHVGFDGTNEWTDRAWGFLRPHVEPADAHVFSRAPFAPDWIDRSRVHVIPPSIDPFTTKNLELRPDEAVGLLAAADLVQAAGVVPDDRVTRRAEVIREGSAPTPDVPLVVQVSRWDRMKGMTGVLQAFVEHVPAPAQLVLAGPEVDGVDDDPEEGQIWAETAEAWARAPVEPRSRVHLAAIPMDDPTENALVVNALQRHARVVTQKSLAEGFGLTVAEAMWKSRPVVASAVGGIVDQIVDGETGRLVDDPLDLVGFGRAVAGLLADRAEAERLGRNARARVAERFLADRHLLQYAELLDDLVRRA
jgi:trehalose synthase